jgi:hypothetical protein
MTIKKLCYFILLCTFSMSNANADFLGIGGWTKRKITRPIMRKVIQPVLTQVGHMTDPIYLLCGPKNKPKAPNCRKTLGKIVAQGTDTTLGKIATLALEGMPVCALKNATKAVGINPGNACNVTRLKWLAQDNRPQGASISAQDWRRLKESELKKASCVPSLVNSWKPLLNTPFNCQTGGAGYASAKKLYFTCENRPGGRHAGNGSGTGMCLRGYGAWYRIMNADKGGICASQRSGAWFTPSIFKKLATEACGVAY